MFYSENLKKLPKIKHCFFSRKNGFSLGIYKSLNCGEGSQDKSGHILKNLDYVAKKLNIESENLMLMNQIHSNKVIHINEKNIKFKKFDSDALVTNMKGLALGVLTADCVPILLYDNSNHIIGAIHAGWKGCVSGVIENTLNKFNDIGKNNNFFACVGPCIGKDSYEVGCDLFEEFNKKSKNNALFFHRKTSKKFQFDLRGYVNNELKKLGVKNLDNINIDTFKDADNSFSYRRSLKLEESDYGRCISTICLKT